MAKEKRLNVSFQAYGWVWKSFKRLVQEDYKSLSLNDAMERVLLTTLMQGQLPQEVKWAEAKEHLEAKPEPKKPNVGKTPVRPTSDDAPVDTVMTE